MVGRRSVIFYRLQLKLVDVGGREPSENGKTVFSIATSTKKPIGQETLLSRDTNEQLIST